MIETILSHVYPNGLALVAQPMDWLQSAAFTVLAPAGCVYDPADRNGLAAFVSELVMRGAGPRDSRQLLLDLDNLGVERHESVSDAHSSFSGATLAENLPAALAIYADVLRRPHLPSEQVEPSRQLLMQELRSIEDEPAQKVMIELRRRHYPKPWGRPAEGDLAALESINLDEIRAFFARRYHPRSTILGVAGKIDWLRLVDQIGELLGDWTPQPETAVESLPASCRYEHIPYASNQTQIGIAYPCVPYRHPDFYQAWSSVSVLSGGMSARLFTEVRERRGLCYSVYAAYHTLRDRGAVFCYAGTSGDRAQETLAVTLGELIRLREGVQPEELARLKARIKSLLIMQQESSSSRSGSIASDWYHLGRVRTLEEIGRHIDELACENINAYLAENPPREFTIVTLGSSDLEVPVGVS